MAGTPPGWGGPLAAPRLAEPPFDPASAEPSGFAASGGSGSAPVPVPLRVRNPSFENLADMEADAAPMASSLDEGAFAMDF
eukprot:SAG31_NODE_2194_length_6224_cov_3.140408_4_plen_81_part_00